MINVALVGCGRIAKRHSELLGDEQIAGMRLVAACDLVEEKAQAIGKRYDVPFFTDMDQMMEAVPIDLVVVLTPTGAHAEHVIQLARFQKDILVE